MNEMSVNSVDFIRFNVFYTYVLKDMLSNNREINEWSPKPYTVELLQRHENKLYMEMVII